MHTYGHGCTISSDILWAPGSKLNRGVNIMKNQGGFSVVEVLVSIFLFGFFLAFALPNLSSLEDPLQDATEETLGLLRQAKAKAISATSAYRLAANGSYQIQASYATNCKAAPASWVPDSRMTFDLPNGVHMSGPVWSVCFDPRGFADSSVQINIQDANLDTRTVEVFVGGAVRRSL